MQNNKRQYIIALILLLASSFLIIHIESIKHIPSSSKDLDQFPSVIGSWRGKNISLPEDVYKVLQTEEVLVREYKDKEDNALLLTIVYSDNNRAAIHPPEICYVGGGLDILTKEVESVVLGDNTELKTNKLLMKHKKGALLAWYWFATRGSFTHNYYLQQINIFLNGLRHKTKEAALIRVSATMSNENAPYMEERAKEFIREIVPYVEKILEKNLIIARRNDKI
ncbi:MAG: EpsI family protein [Candidatus Omnitrophota bacterium]|nr:MAG: EpsI family protein [Candidatus Omnitrophota bacterium]